MLAGDSSVVGEILDVSEFDSDLLEDEDELVANNSKNKNHNTEEIEDIVFLIDSTSVDDLVDSSNKDNDNMNEDIEENIRDINMRTDAPPSNNNTSNANNPSLIY